MKPAIVIIVFLGLPGLLPALSVARRSPAVVFLAPIAGALMAAAGAEIELGVGGSLLTGYALVAAVVNVAVIAWWLIAGRSAERQCAPWLRPASAWYVGILGVIAVALAVPLFGLRGHIVGWDTSSIWITHALLISGGHHALLDGLTNPSYLFASPDYPPLLPAVGALGYAFFGRTDLFLYVGTTELVAACGLGLLGTGIAAAAGTGWTRTRLAGLAAAGFLCVTGFAVAGIGGISGYADLPWAAMAVAAIVWGLVVPRSSHALGIAWICVAAASLTKNEGLTTGLGLIVLIALRYRPLTTEHTLRAWAERAAFVIVPAVPGLCCAAEVRLIGIGDGFFRGSSGQALATRASATVSGMAQHLAIAPVALGMLIAGGLFLRLYRRRRGLGNPLWLWTGFLSATAAIFVTYLVGSQKIAVWLHSSVSRTMVFGQLALFTEVAIWLVIAVDALSAEADIHVGAATPALAHELLHTE